MAYVIHITGPANTGKRNLAARILNELAGRGVDVELSEEESGGRPDPGRVRIAISDGPPPLADTRGSDLCMEVHVFEPGRTDRGADPGEPEVVIHSRRDGLKTGLNRIMHYLETHRLIPESGAGSPYAEMFSALAGVPARPDGLSRL